MFFSSRNTRNFLNALTHMITEQVYRFEAHNLDEDEHDEKRHQPTSSDEILATIQKNIIKLCQDYQILESNKCLRTLHFKKNELSTLLTKDVRTFPAAAIILTGYVLNEGDAAKKLTKKQRKIYYILLVSLSVSAIVTTVLGIYVAIPLFLLAAATYFGFKPALKYHKTHEVLHSQYSDLPEPYKNIIDCDLSRRNIEIFPSDTIKDVLEKTTDYKKYQDKRAKKISKELSLYSVFAQQKGPKLIVLDYAIYQERSLSMQEEYNNSIRL